MPNAVEKHSESNYTKWDTGAVNFGTFVFTIIYAIAAIAIAVVAIWQADLSADAIAAAREHSQRELRAYVTYEAFTAPTGITPIVKAPPNAVWLGSYPQRPFYVMDVKAVIRNSGRTPGQKVRYDLKYFLNDYGTAPGALPCPTRKEAARSPNMFISADEARGGDPQPLLLNQQTLYFLNNKTKALYLCGCISYRDTFQIARCTEVCAIYDAASARFTFCENNNELDSCNANYED
jgi:hypothetical protein